MMLSLKEFLNLMCIYVIFLNNGMLTIKSKYFPYPYCYLVSAQTFNFPLISRFDQVSQWMDSVDNTLKSIMTDVSDIDTFEKEKARFLVSLSFHCGDLSAEL